MNTGCQVARFNTFPHRLSKIHLWAEGIVQCRRWEGNLACRVHRFEEPFGGPAHRSGCCGTLRMPAD